MAVRKAERVAEMAAAIWRGLQEIRCQARVRPADSASGRRCGVAGAVLAAAVVMAGALGPAAGQGQPRGGGGTGTGGGGGTLEELFDRDAGKIATLELSRPLAVAYLAAPYSGGPKGLSASFRIGAKAPATSLSPKLMQPEGQPWEGYRIELYKGNEWLSREGSRLGLGGQMPLSVTLYAFVPESRPVRVSRIWTWESDAWNEKADEFSILSDTSFQLEANPVIKGVLASSLREIVACVNKRSQRPECDGETGAVIEDPLSGQPSLLMVLRGGPPEWLKEVPTEICVDGQEGHMIRVPDSWQPIPLDQKVGDRWCSPIVKLNYIALREEGLRIGSLEGKKQLDTRFAPDNVWRMWAERPKALRVAERDVWVQRIILHPPKSEAPNDDNKTVSAQEKAVSVQEKVKPVVPPAAPQLPVSPKADTPKADTPSFPPGPKVSVVFKSRDSVATERLVQHAKVQIDPDGTFADVERKELRFTLPEESGFTVTKCVASKVNCSHEGPNIVLLPKAGVALSSPVVVSLEFAPLKRNIDLTIKREGPALLSIQQVSKGKAIDLIDPQREKGSVLATTVQWSPGDKLRVRPVDDEFQEVSEITVDGKAWGKHDEVSLPPDAKAVAIAIKTADRSFTVPLTVATKPKVGVDIKLERTFDPPKVGAPVDAQSKPLTIEGLKPGHTLTVEPQESDRLEVAMMMLSGGRSPRAVDGPKLRFERSDFQGAKLALNLDVTLQEAAFTVPDKFRLQPVVKVGKRELVLKSCRVELDGFLEGSKFTRTKGYTEVTLAQDRRAPKTHSYKVKAIGDALVCSELEGAQPIKAVQLDPKQLQSDATLTVPFRLPTRRVFVGIVSLSEDIRSKEPIWRAALAALRVVFDAGAEKGKYVSGAIYGPEGQLLVTTGDSADYAPLELEKEVFKSSKMDDLIGGSAKAFGSLVTRVANLKEVADLEGYIDTLIVADEQFMPCGWSDSPFAKGSRAALVRLTSTPGKGKEVESSSAVRLCDSTEKSKNAGVVAEVEVLPREWTRRWPQEKQLELAISEAADKGFGIKVQFSKQ